MMYTMSSSKAIPTKSREKVRCVHCGKLFVQKNMKSHVQTAHPDKKEEYDSTSSVDILNFGAPPTKISRTDDNASTSESPSNDDPEVSNTESADQVSTETGNDDSTNNIFSQLQLLNRKVDRLEQQEFRNNITLNVTDLSSVLKPENMMELLVSCRSVELILSVLPFFTIKNDTITEGLFCTICECTLKYNFSNGLSFEPTENLPTSFSHLKESVKRHVQSSSHICTANEKEKNIKEQERLYKQGKEAAVNCASAAYLGYKLGLSYISYENIVTEIHESGGNVGLKNHSKEFSRNFLGYIYDTLRTTFVSYVTDNKYPFGLLADKMTAKHRKRHIMGVRVPIWDLNNYLINRDIYVRHSAVGYGSGEAIVDHLLTNLQSFGFSLPYIRKHLCGMAMDGQYTCLNVGTHMSDTLVKNINLSWDPMHQIELASKDSSVIDDAKIIEDTVSTIHNTFLKFKVGNNFEVLYSEKELCETFFSPKIFKDMKFVTYSSEVFRSFINDYKALVSAADKIEDGEEIKGKLLDTKFLMSMLFLADVNCFMSKFSKKVQISTNLPWDYSSSFDYMLGQIDLMMDEIIFIRNKLKEMIDSDYDGLFNGLSSHLFPFFMTVKDILTKTEYQGIPLKHRDQSQLRSFDPMYTLPGKQLERLVNFGVRYLAALRDNLTGRFDCHTMTMCRKFRELLDPSPYFYPSNNFSTKEPLDDVKTFKDFIKIVPLYQTRRILLGHYSSNLQKLKRLC